MNKKLLLIFIPVAIIGYWTGFNYACIQQFNYCYLESWKTDGQCGVYFIDRWEYPIEQRLIDFGLSFVKCEGIY